jgi:hypothetical protein
MAEDWSPEEVALIVADYFVMLGHALRGESFNKREHNRRLQSLLKGRSAGSVEFKHANISAVLIEMGFPYVDGYKPRSNYQELLRDEIEARLEREPSVLAATSQLVQASAPETLPIPALADILVDPPKRERAPATYERRAPTRMPRLGVNYLEMEARNASLGRAGELFALDFEHRRLRDAGKKALAERIEHVSATKGDGLGFDILSFDESGRERLIEVKTTSFGSMTPFFASVREVAVSEERAAEYSLYRVFKFREAPRLFVLPGSLRESVDLQPAQYRASLL